MTEPKDLLLKRAELLLDARRPAEAIPLLMQAIALDPENADLYCTASQAYLGHGRPKQALKMAQAAIRCDPNEEWGYRLASISCTELGRRKEALQFAREGVRLEPTAELTLDRLGNCALDLKQYQEVQQIADELSATYPDSISTYDLLGRLRMRQGLYHQAEEYFRRALQRRPDDPEAHNNLALALRSQKKWTEALTQLKEAARLSPADTVIRQNLLGTTSSHLWSGAAVGLAVLTRVAIRIQSAHRGGASQNGQAEWWLTILVTVAAACLCLLIYRTWQRYRRLDPTVAMVYRENLGSGWRRLRRQPFEYLMLFMMITLLGGGVYLLIAGPSLGLRLVGLVGIEAADVLYRRRKNMAQTIKDDFQRSSG